MFIKKQRRWFFIALFFVVAILIFFWWKTKNDAAPVVTPTATRTVSNSVVTTTISLLSGTLAPIEESTSTYAAVMIDNYTLETSQFGITSSTLVFEAPVEGGITRFMAVFALSAGVAQIGPVRSARPYFVDWAREFGGLFVHVGGSTEALEKIQNMEGLINVDDMKSGTGFWRDAGRVVPHSTFTSTDLLQKIWFEKAPAERLGTANSLVPWLFFKDEKKSSHGNATSTFVRVGGLNVEWKYDKAQNNYNRNLDGVLQKDGNNQEIVAKNVAVMFTDIKSIDAIDRQQIKTIGSGRALILRDGKEISGSWSKFSASSRLRFFGPDTKEILFNPGVTWIEVSAR